MTTPKEPASATVLAARIQRAYPTLSPYSAATLAEELCRIERAQRRHAERCCSGEDGGYVKRVRSEMHHKQDALDARMGRAAPLAATIIHDPEAERRAGERIGNALERWRSLRTLFMGFGMPRDAIAPEQPVIELDGDPRGAVLKVRFPGESEAVWS